MQRCSKTRDAVRQDERFYLRTVGELPGRSGELPDRGRTDPPEVNVAVDVAGDGIPRTGHRRNTPMATGSQGKPLTDEVLALCISPNYGSVGSTPDVHACSWKHLAELSTLLALH